MKSCTTYQLAKALYHQVVALKLKGHLRDQAERAASSIVLNLAEGNTRKRKERVRHYTIAMGSLREVQAVLDLTGRAELEEQADKLGAHLYKLIQNPGPDPRT